MGKKAATFTGKNSAPYIPSPELVEAVQLAMYLERPLLLKGEPGSGKTALAAAVAKELNLPYEMWSVKSTSRARDLLYVYDTVGRLRDAQLAAARRLPATLKSRLEQPRTYIRWGPLGKAFLGARRSVVLIDEIDKADIDFPNDLLLELDEKRFLIEETGEQVRARESPIVFITSNDEKDLPDAFLRRCVFHYIEFPATERLVQIIMSHFPDTPNALADAAVKRFVELRADSRIKKASTSELIDWFRVLRREPQEDVFQKLKGRLPYLSLLLKSWNDHVAYLGRTEK